MKAIGHTGLKTLTKFAFIECVSHFQQERRYGKNAIQAAHDRLCAQHTGMLTCLKVAVPDTRYTEVYGKEFEMSVTTCSSSNQSIWPRVFCAAAQIREYIEEAEDAAQGSLVHYLDPHSSQVRILLCVHMQATLQSFRV